MISRSGGTEFWSIIYDSDVVAEDSASAVELGSSDDFWVWRDSVFVNDLCFSRSLWTLKISPSAMELSGGDDF